MGRDIEVLKKKKKNGRMSAAAKRTKRNENDTMSYWGGGGEKWSLRWEVRVGSLNNVPSQVVVYIVLYAPQLSPRFQPLDGGMFGDFGRFGSILGDFSVGTLPKHSRPGSRLGTEHYLKSALVGHLPRKVGHQK
jgi:hypothetical protein